MAEIGSTLRETRIRDKIDITTVEEATKIRAKYLRALENEEWAVLPGPAYVKSFLRSYAAFLGLDAHLLVEEYKARFEQPEDLELPAFRREPPLRGLVRPPGPPSRAAIVAALALAFVVVLFVLGITGNDNNKGSSGKSASRTKSAQGGSKRQPAGTTAGSATTANQVTLSVVPSRAVWVCLVDARKRARIAGRTIPAGERQGPFRSRRFDLTVGNGGGDFKVNGKLRDVPDKSTPLGYAITASGTRLLPADARPTCEATASQTGGAGVIAR